jgi:phosphatidylglycerophosphatase A
MTRFTPGWWVASGFGSGASPVAPGTAGSLVGLAPALVVAAILLATAGGLWAIHAATGQAMFGHTEADHDDPGWIVVDEIAGQMIALLALHKISLIGVALAFALFRLFDISKPGPIGWADRQGGAAGIMADDLLAGVAAALVLTLVYKVVSF